MLSRKGFNKLTTIAGASTAIARVAMVAGTPMLFQNAAAVTTPADDCRNAVKTALTDKRITDTEFQTIKAECANGGAPSGCLTTIAAARADYVIMQAEITAIKAACRIS
ncbi:MAG TPA: hypothetical protein VGQ03_03280 [Nitrososphaera sp.]|jgi:hypothetical protein|nr:hypothetical protein [Nitrososphaera sp.]